MLRRFGVWLLPVLVLGLASACNAAGKAKEVTDPEEAKADPDFAFQGEYIADCPELGKLGLQVIALGGGKFDVSGYVGGLPGDGWKRGDERLLGEGTRDGETLTIKNKPNGKVVAKISDGKIVALDGDKQVGAGKKVERKSKTLCEQPPAGAVVLFDGSSAAKWDNPDHVTKDKSLLSGVTTKDKFNSYKLHLEFRLSWMPEARGQGRSNSGVYVHDCYEIQVLDSFGLEGKNNECGGFYSVREPDVNMCFPPMTWQTYDIEFTAPKYEGDNKVANARITVVHNGVVIHKDLELPKETPGRQKEGPGPRPLHFQGHGNQVFYRNIWLQETK